MFSGYIANSIGRIHKDENTCPVRVDRNVQNVFFVTIGKQNYPLSRDGMKNNTETQIM